ncbi:MAG: DUF4391 domain-containing protein [Prevotella sp.]|nr:DUF4391 domain-containing protein [Prevotella sp.]
MDNILGYPESCVVNRVVPKTMFYRFMEVNPKMKKRFVDDVLSITWLYKLAPSNLNVTDSDDMKEIEVFVAILKEPDCPTDLFNFIDRNMPHHIVFILQHNDHSMLLLNYKKWTDETHTQFQITQMFASPWMPTTSLKLNIEGQSLPRIYENFVAQVSGIGEHKAGRMEEIVELRQRIEKETKEMGKLERKMLQERQTNIQMELHAQVKAKRKELDELKKQLAELK